MDTAPPPLKITGHNATDPTSLITQLLNPLNQTTNTIPLLHLLTGLAFIMIIKYTLEIAQCLIPLLTSLLLTIWRNARPLISTFSSLLRAILDAILRLSSIVIKIFTLILIVAIIFGGIFVLQHWLPWLTEIINVATMAMPEYVPAKKYPEIRVVNL